MRTLLSIVIPTYNRYQYLLECLDVLLSFQSNRFEIIVQDNSSDNGPILDYLACKHDDRLRYYHDSSKHYSQTKNSELAVEKATGEYICYIGDDDALSRVVIDIVDWMSLNEIDALLFPGSAYYWSDVAFSHGYRPSFAIDSFSGLSRSVNALAEYEECGAFGASEINDMPRLYHGIVKTDTLKLAKEAAGAFFPGPSPDMASSVVLSHVVKRLVKIDIPILVDGFSYKSAGGKSLRGQHKAKLEDVEQLPDNILDTWNEKIPRIWLGETIYAQSYYEASRRLQLPDLIDYNRLYVAVISRHPECIKYVMRCDVNKGKALLFAKATYALILRITRFVIRKLNKRLGQQNEMMLSIENCTISNAEQILSEEIAGAVNQLIERK